MNFISCKFRLCLLMLFVGVSVAAQDRLISGTVTDAIEGSGLPGVNISLKSDPSLGTTTDLDGNYSISVPETAKILVFSFVGMKTREVAISGLSKVDVILGIDTEVLEEAIVTAIGIKKDKKSLGYAVQQVDGDQLAESRQTNIVNALSSKVAGVEVTSSSGSPGASANIVIRGRSSLQGSNSPLFVVDGVPIDNSFAGSNFIDHSNRAIDLNADDIESMTVLKGPAAAALYGVRAANGAVIITTKSGADKDRSEVTFSTFLTFDQVNKLPQQQKLFAQGRSTPNGPVYVDPAAGINSSWGPRIDTLRYDGNPDYAYDPRGRIVGMSHPSAGQPVVPFDNVQQFFRTGVTSSTHLSFSNGNDYSSYYLSAGHLEQSGIVPNSNFSRTTIKLTGAISPVDKFTSKASLSYTKSGGDRMQRGSNLSGVMLGLMRTPPTFDLSNGLDDPADNPAAYTLPDGDQRTYNRSYDNPYWSVNKNRSTDDVNRLIGFTEFGYELTPWLRALYRIGIDYYNENRLTYWDDNSNEFGIGLLIHDVYTFRSINSDFLVTATKSFGEDYEVSATIGQNFLDENSKNTIVEGEDFSIPDLYTIENVSFITFADDFLSNYRLISGFYDLKFSYKQFLYFSTTGRMDWSSTLPSENNSFFYPSFNLGLVFSEPFNLSTNPVFSYGKIRLSFAEVGNDAPRYALGNYFVSTTAVQGQTSFLPSTSVGNVNLKPERTRSIEGGLDLRFFRNRLGIDITAYRTLSDGQILNVPISFSSGSSTIVANAGEIENKGIELLVNATPVKTEHFTWDATVNFSSNRNTVLKLAEGVPDIRFTSTGLASTSSRAIEGEPFSVIYGTRWMRNANGDILIDDDGYPLQDTIPGIVGDPNPDWMMGIRNTFSFKGFTISALLDFRQGGDIFNGTVGVMRNLGIHASTESREEEVVIDGVMASDGTPNTIPIKLDYDYYRRYPFAGVSEASVEDGSWIRLRELSIQYRLPEKILATLPVKGLEIGISARNLFLITDYSGIDPETNLSGASNSIGRDYFNSPNTKSWGANLRVIF